MKKILFVEDDPGIQDSVRLVFDPTHYQVDVHPSAEQIMEGEYELPDIFVIDKQLPGVSGIDVCRQLKSQEATSGIPVILVSASPSVNQLSRLAGADYFIEKPYTVKHLREVIKRYI